MVESGMPPLPPSAPSGAETDQAPAAPAMPLPPPVASRKHIEVVAVGVGFWDNHRKNEGDRFTVPKLEDAGSWMKCIDPKIEREHQARMKDKKKKANTADD